MFLSGIGRQSHPTPFPEKNKKTIRYITPYEKGFRMYVATFGVFLVFLSSSSSDCHLCILYEDASLMNLSILL